MTSSRVLLGLEMLSPKSVRMSSGKKTLKRIVCDFKEFAKELIKVNKAVGEMTSDFNLGVDWENIQELLEMVAEELTNEEFVGVEREIHS